MNDDYLLGHGDQELRRLEDQARALAPATHTILTLAGIEPGMRVLDLGSGAGDVAIAVAEMVGASGSVVGIDRAPEALAWARARCAERGVANVHFVQADLQEDDVSLGGPFDAVVARLALLYTPEPALVLKRFASLLRPGGLVVVMEYEMTAAGMLPSDPLAERVVGWICEAFRRSGLDPLLGARLGDVLRGAGLASPAVLGLQAYLPAGHPVGPRMAADVVRTLLPTIERTGIATADEVAIESLHERLTAVQTSRGAVFKPPTLVGAWGRVA
jgi:SAM-dependent methyltransferase